VNINNDSYIKSITQKGSSIPFSEQYIALRKKEARIYTDSEVLHLPDISRDHIHAKEWKVRKHSCSRLMNYLKKKGPLEIVEVGCGNGWLSNQLSNLPGCHVTGMDINALELSQAKRVFSNNPNITFFYGDIHQLGGKGLFDVVIFAASIQYFESLQETINLAMKSLRSGGELHIIDSPFYHLKEISSARTRTKEYFSKTDVPEMENYYFHHSIESLKEFHYTFLQNPHSLKSKLLRNRDPFFWIRIRKKI
jgi:ubiquinone/menaquinone biosynthesis C-methylase UbiE